MISRIDAYLTAIVLLLICGVAVLIAKRKRSPFLATDRARLQWSATQLLVASFVTLFAELAFIRWIAVEVWIFAYFKNLALLLCFLGFGVGCALAAKEVRWATAVKAFLALLLIVRVPFMEGELQQRVSLALGSINDVGIWGPLSNMPWKYFIAAIGFVGCLFVLIVLVFIPLGQMVGREMDSASNTLRGYSFNLIGSLVGVVTFFLLSRWMLPPIVWMAIILLGFAFLQSNRRTAMVIVGLVVPVALLLFEPSHSGIETLWTPYQQIHYEREYTSSGEVRGGMLQINHRYYQETLNLSPEFLARHPELGGESSYNRYNLPFRFAGSSPKVLIVGSGTGNDVAAALRHNSMSVDAVEIDPAIIELGKLEHPEHPYDSSRVIIHMDDARSFLKRTNQRYDLILFGLLDSHVQFSNYSNMQIDNFVYTEEAFREAERLLTPNGVIFVKFRVNREWIATRLSEILEQVFNTPPLVFAAERNYAGGATCFVAGHGNHVNNVLSADQELADFVHRNQLAAYVNTVPITTDDWPYLYQQNRQIPRTFYSVGLLVLLIALAFHMSVKRTTQIPGRFSVFFFGMGAGFMLLETQIISRTGLFFGTVWQVTGIVISALLVTLLLANLIAERTKPLMARWMWPVLVATLACAYWFPFDRIEASATMTGAIEIGIFSVPVLFAGLLFSSEFKKAASPSAALNANVLGAVFGGLLENISLTYGLRALVLIALVLYCLAGVGLLQRKAGLPSNAKELCGEYSD